MSHKKNLNFEYYKNYLKSTQLENGINQLEESKGNGDKKIYKNQ